MELNRRNVLEALGLASIGAASSGIASGDGLSFASQKSRSSIGSAVNYADDVIYQIVTDRFRDGNPRNNPDGELYSEDGSDLRKYHGGDWQGIVEKIEDGYLTELGVSALWISAPVENVTEVGPDTGSSYHGYWTRDYKDPNEFFGDMDAFEELVEVAHENGIKIVIDFVPNHTSPSAANNEFEDGAFDDNGHDVASYNDDPETYFHHNGGTDYSSYEGQIYRNLYNLADFDHQERFVDAYLKESIKLWLDKGIDGIRVDAVAHMSPGWQKTLMDAIYDYEPVFTFGEWFLGAGQSSQNYYEFSNDSGMSVLDFRFGQKLRQVLRNWDDDFYGLWDVIQETRSEHDQVIDQVPFIDNHDMARFAGEDELWSAANTDMALAVLLTSRGVPLIYYGTEQYMTGGGDPTNRKPMETFDRSTNAYGIIQKLSDLRQSSLALQYGDTRQRWVDENVFVYERSFGGDVVLVAINRDGFNEYEFNGLQTALPEGAYADELGGLLDGVELTVDENGSAETFSLGPQTVSVWSYGADATEPELGHVGPTMGQPGHTVELAGAGFGDEAGSVEIGGESAEIESWSDEKVEAEVPAGVGGEVSIAVTDADGRTSDSFDHYEVLTGDQVSVRFVCQDAETELGENVYVVGNVPELGNWDADKAVGPFFNKVIYEYPDWYQDISVPADTELEFKFIKKDGDGNVTWESGDNHTFTTPKALTRTQGGSPPAHSNAGGRGKGRGKGRGNGRGNGERGPPAHANPGGKGKRGKPTTSHKKADRPNEYVGAWE
ncbi:alpha-amylase family glycosyl hydrolase [Natronoarchaeum mannanilyticum]|uniref:Alpha-amylase AmyA n=1 Tax=Natronoarchaeum mannanilyticum TaxID=926360 RepID=A0AAV3T662_9EURY